MKELLVPQAISSNPDMTWAATWQQVEGGPQPQKETHGKGWENSDLINANHNFMRFLADSCSVGISKLVN